jgi:hypothetical protein
MLGRVSKLSLISILPQQDGYPEGGPHFPASYAARFGHVTTSWPMGWKKWSCVSSQPLAGAQLCSFLIFFPLVPQCQGCPEVPGRQG